MNALEEMKTRQLELWHALFQDHRSTQSSIDFQHDALRKHAEVMHKLGVIEADELFELNELADTLCMCGQANDQHN